MTTLREPQAVPNVSHLAVGLTEPMISFMSTALDLEKREMGFGVTELSHHATLRQLVKRGLLERDGNGMDEDTGRDMPLYRLTANGRILIEALTGNAAAGRIERLEARIEKARSWLSSGLTAFNQLTARDCYKAAKAALEGNDGK